MGSVGRWVWARLMIALRNNWLRTGRGVRAGRPKKRGLRPRLETDMTTNIPRVLSRARFATLSARALLVAFALLMLGSAPVQAQPGFVLWTPASGALVPVGQPVTINWTGGDPSWNVVIQLIDVATFSVSEGIGPVPNTGTFVWSPTTLSSGGACGRTYQFYVENSPRTQWTYGHAFTAFCSTTGPLIINVADGDVSGLIAAINATNAHPGPDTINLAPNGTYTLTAVADDGGGYWGPTGLPWIRSQLTINGNGSTIQRSSSAGTPNFRILFIDGDVTLDGVTLKGGASDPAVGGGLYNRGTALIRNSTITGNSALSAGGIQNFTGVLTLVNSTVSYNSAWFGGGIMDHQATTRISNSTIFENQASGGGGDAIAGQYSLPGSMIIKNSVIASPTRGRGDDCIYFVPVSRGHNIASDASCSLTGPGDLNNTNPMLGPLANNGGPTPTHLPLSGSPAIDAIPVGACTDVSGNPVASDQRGVSRPQGAGCDVGSVDTSSDTTAPVITPNISGALGNNGWYRNPVTVTWSVTDPESGIAASSGCVATLLSADTPGVTLTCSATNGAGLSNSVSATIKIDQTAPSLTFTRTPPPNGAGWNNTDVTVAFSCTDAMSGVAMLSPVSVTLLGEGSNQSTSSVCRDNAGQPATLVVGGINIDKTKPLTTGATATPNPLAINTAVELAANLSDAGGSNLASAEYSVNGSAPTVLAAANGASVAVNGTLPAFTATGVYNVCLRALDVAGNIGPEDCLLLPVYDPSGGFVTGGGWINSPAGAYSANPALTGKATFGFESRYQPGAQVPTGDTQFQFRVAGLNFKSTAYEWLVVAGARAQYKGTGTINGSGSYNFLLTAIDGGQPGGGGQDKFRLKITGPGGVVYDNEMGRDENGDPTTVLGGGSIVIHIR